MACLIETEMVGTRDGGGTWEREARCVAMLAGELGLALNAEALLLADVREVMALRQRLQAALGRPRWRRMRNLNRFV